MSELTKRVEDLTVADLEAFPIWEYANSDGLDETVVRPIKKLPVENLSGRLVGLRVCLASGHVAWALIGNFDCKDARLNQHFLTLSIFDEGRRFTMARYHDFDRDRRGPAALAAFLKLPIEEVFPISYDIGRLCAGEIAALAGKLEMEPREKLTRAQIIALAVP